MNASAPPSKSISNEAKAKRSAGFIVILGILSAFGPLSLDMYLPALPLITQELNTSASLAQLSITACLLGLALGQLLAGPLSDKLGRRKPLIVSLAIYAVASFICTFAPNISVLLFFRLLQGLAGSAGIVISRAMARDLYSGYELTKFFALLMLVNGTAPILAPVLGGALLTLIPWRGVFVVLGFIGIAMLFAVTLRLGETLPEERRSSGGVGQTLSTFGDLFKDRSFMGYALTQSATAIALFSYISGSSFVLQNLYHVTPQTFSLIFALNGFGMVLASQTTGRLAGRMSAERLLAGALALIVLGTGALLAAILAEARLLFLMIPLFIAVASIGGVNITCNSLALQNQKKHAGSASAILGLLPYLAGAAASPLVGIAGENSALPMGFLMAGASVLAVLFFFLLARRKG
ncbi:multidrug effflux MFS transporter [Gorillibacterium timonense]|uniref:multidrug effflux MFS transporter n=1 Tax=Gorillibacterium timonense TaxID=1689269 RepID=UPI00071C3BDA|nr:multidrug effflux MFS transporter [Gorillibacterium timonense]